MKLNEIYKNMNKLANDGDTLVVESSIGMIEITYRTKEGLQCDDELFKMLFDPADPAPEYKSVYTARLAEDHTLTSDGEIVFYAISNLFAKEAYQRANNEYYYS